MKTRFFLLMVIHYQKSEYPCRMREQLAYENHRRDSRKAVKMTQIWAHTSRQMIYGCSPSDRAIVNRVDDDRVYNLVHPGMWMYSHYILCEDCEEYSRPKASAILLEVETHPEGNHHIDDGWNCKSECEHVLNFCEIDRNIKKIKWTYAVLRSKSRECFEMDPIADSVSYPGKRERSSSAHRKADVTTPNRRVVKCTLDANTGRQHTYSRACS